MKRLVPVAGLEPGDRIFYNGLPATVTGAPDPEAHDSLNFYSLSFYVHVDGAAEPVRVYRHVAAWIEPIHAALGSAARSAAPAPLWPALDFVGYNPDPQSVAELLDNLAGIARQLYGVLSGLADGSDSAALREADRLLWAAVPALQAAADAAKR